MQANDKDKGYWISIIYKELKLYDETMVLYQWLIYTDGGNYVLYAHITYTSM